ncbi:ABC transporter permease [Planctomycetota bacterium]
MTELFRCVVYELRRRKARTLTTSLGYALAILIGIVLTHALIWTRQASDQILNHTGTHFTAFIPTERGMCPPCAANWLRNHTQEGFVALGVSSALIPPDFIGKVSGLDTVAEAAGYLQYRLRDAQDDHLITVGGMKTECPLVLGTTCCAPSDIVEGRFLAAHDVNAVVLEQGYAQMRGLHAGDGIELAGESLSVVGVVNPGIRPAKADVYMLHVTTSRIVRERMGESGPKELFNMILVEVTGSDVQDEAIREVKGLWTDLVISSYACYKPAAQASMIHTVAIGTLMLMLGVGAVAFSMQSQLSSVFERRRELGILKSLGYSHGELIQLLLSESLLQALIGAVVGAGLGLTLLTCIPTSFWGITQQQAPLIPSIFLSGILLALLGGFIAGSVPAVTIIRRCPSDLLRCL